MFICCKRTHSAEHIVDFCALINKKLFIKIILNFDITEIVKRNREARGKGFKIFKNLRWDRDQAIMWPESRLIVSER